MVISRFFFSFFHSSKLTESIEATELSHNNQNEQTQTIKNDKKLINTDMIKNIFKIPINVIDFDVENLNDPNQVSEYAMDIFNYFRLCENDYKIDAYMKFQFDINKSMREKLIDWMVHVQESFSLNHETLYYSVKYLDLFLNKKIIKRDNLQLLGAGAMLVACKFDVSFSILTFFISFFC